MTITQRCALCGSKMMLPVPTRGVKEATGEVQTFDGTTCRVCLYARGFVSEAAYARIQEEEA